MSSPRVSTMRLTWIARSGDLAGFRRYIDRPDLETLRTIVRAHELAWVEA